MYDVQLRDTPEQRLLSAERRVTVDGLGDAITTTAAALAAHLDAAGVTDRGPLRVIYHGMVTQDSDGPVEIAVPFTGAVQPAGDLRVRVQPAGAEAYAQLTAAQGEFPAILGAYDAVGHWIDRSGMRRAGSPAEIYFGDLGEGADPEAPALDVAWPVQPG